MALSSNTSDGGEDRERMRHSNTSDDGEDRERGDMSVEGFKVGGMTCNVL